MKVETMQAENITDVGGVSNEKDSAKTKQMRYSLCWYCSRATDSSCPWSESFIPVDGWVAKKEENKCRYGNGDSYFVEECPMFAQYEYKGEISDKGVRELAGAVMKNAGKTYLKLLKKEKKQRKRDAGLLTKRILYRYTDEELWEQKKSLYGFEPMDIEISGMEKWFRSEDALMFGMDIDPVWLMETIQKEVGI